ncbi:odorant-binding protein 1b-like [Grammomys surdaster]|uniref:odorant-binding protein 1b-like n=1 Tax=Grammomys surdaster TaxID=491861 RepID=UPI00109F1A8C|nr:odorant-binding protein 1b-like [Grammomys surdaster]
MMVKFFLLALAFGLAHAKLQGKWRTIAIAADNEDKIEDGGPLELFVRKITCQEGCKVMNVEFYIKQNGYCSLTTVTGYLQEDGHTYINLYEGENQYVLVKATSEYLIFYSENVDRASRRTKLLFLVGKGGPLTNEGKEQLAEYAKEKDIPLENIREILTIGNCNIEKLMGDAFLTIVGENLITDLLSQFEKEQYEDNTRDTGGKRGKRVDKKLCETENQGEEGPSGLYGARKSDSDLLGDFDILVMLGCKWKWLFRILAYGPEE